MTDDEKLPSSDFRLVRIPQTDDERLISIRFEAGWLSRILGHSVTIRVHDFPRGSGMDWVEYREYEDA